MHTELEVQRILRREALSVAWLGGKTHPNFVPHSDIEPHVLVQQSHILTHTERERERERRIYIYIYMYKHFR